MIELRRISKLNDMTFGESLVDCFIQNSSNMLGGIHNELTYMTMQAMSTGEIHDVAVDGYKFDFKFQIPDENFVAPDAGKEWFKADGKEIANDQNGKSAIWVGRITLDLKKK